MNTEIITIAGQKFAPVHGELISLNRRMVRAQDYIWELWHGEVPKGFKAVNINGNIFDNHLGNLELVACESHMVPKPEENPVVISTFTKVRVPDSVNSFHVKLDKKSLCPCECINCKKIFPPNSAHQKFCGTPCRKQYYHVHKIDCNDKRICEKCNQEFECIRSSVKKYCSISCSITHSALSLKTEQIMCGIQ